jgi:hypothetical protein
VSEAATVAMPQALVVPEAPAAAGDVLPVASCCQYAVTRLGVLQRIAAPVITGQVAGF